MAEGRGDLDELFRVYANLTTVLDLLGRRGEAVDVANEGSRRRGEPGWRRSSATSSGRTPRTRCTSSAAGPEARAISETALEWSPGGAIARPIDYLAIARSR